MTSSPIFAVRQHTASATTFIAFCGRPYFFVVIAVVIIIFVGVLVLVLVLVLIIIIFLLRTGHQSALPSSSWLESYTPPCLTSNPRSRPSLLSSTLSPPSLLR